MLFIALIATVLALGLAASAPTAVAGCPSYDPNCQQPRP